MKLIIVEDHPIVISGCRALFSQIDGTFTIVHNLAIDPPALPPTNVGRP